MKVIVLGMGQQGKATIHDLEASDVISGIIAADLFPTEASFHGANHFLKSRSYDKTSLLKLDVKNEQNLSARFKENGIDIVICMLPIHLALTAAKAALDVGIPFVSSNYTYDLAQLHEEAIQKKGTILPEMGLDPGIDLIMGRMAVDELDEVHGLYSYGGGVPAPECADTSPIKYKISWIFDRVLDVYVRSAQMIKKGIPVEIPGNRLFHEGVFHEITFENVGTVEAYPNGNAQRYVDIFGLGDELLEMGRFALRWQGHSQFWRTMVDLGLLDGQPIQVNGADVSPRDFLSKCLTPHLQFKDSERDVALLRVLAWGLKNGEKKKITYDLIDYRDLETGLFAMNRTVGFTSSIGAQMILKGLITEPGVLSPVNHVPPQEFMAEIKARGMKVDCTIENDQ